MTWTAILLAIVLGLVLPELRGWMPFAARLLVRVSARLLPPSQRDRFHEEWSEQIETLTESGRPLSGLLWAIGIPVASCRILLDQRQGQLAFKRALDIALSSVLIALSVPVFLMVSAIIRISSPGPVLVRREMIGRNGRVFTQLTFRTSTGMGSRAVTFGNVLRQASLDQAPQMWNVLRGDMSFVGPRPRAPRQGDGGEEPPSSALRPGMTGLAQLEELADPEAKDDEYVTTWSTWLDLKLLLRTVIFLFRDHPYR